MGKVPVPSLPPAKQLVLQQADYLISRPTNTILFSHDSDQFLAPDKKKLLYKFVGCTICIIFFFWLRTLHSKIMFMQFIHSPTVYSQF